MKKSAYTITARFLDNNMPPITETANERPFAEIAALSIVRRFASVRAVAIKDEAERTTDIYTPQRIPNSTDGITLKHLFTIPPLPAPLKRAA